VHAGYNTEPIPARTGIGLRADHYAAILQQQPRIGFVEVHSENYFGDGGKPVRYLEQVREIYPVSLHGVGLSLGSIDPLDLAHLGKLAALADRFAPALVSEHLSWGSIGGVHSNDLLPLPYTEESLRHLVERIGAVQDFLQRQILIENVSSYLEYSHSTIPEWEFLDTLATTSGCGILLDINNVYVNARNHGFDPLRYLDSITPGHVREMHLAGHTENDIGDATILIDTHNRPVAEPVWQLYANAIQRFPDIPALIEWDTELPPLATLLDEATRADRTRDQHALVA